LPTAARLSDLTGLCAATGMLITVHRNAMSPDEQFLLMTEAL